MNRTINDLTAYKKLKDANIEVGHAILASRREARSLDEQYKGTKLPEHAVKLKAAQNEVKKLEKEYTKNKKSLTALDEKIKNAGIDTKDLDVLFAKLREQINKTAEAQEKYKNAMAGLAKIKFNVTQVSKNFKSVAVNLFNGVKLFVKGVSAIAGASLLAVNSMAKQGG